MLLELLQHPELLNLVVSAVGLALMGWLGTKFASKRDVEGLKAIVDSHKSRLDIVEERLKHIPSVEDVQHINAGISTLKEGQAGHREWREGIKDALADLRRRFDLMDEFLRSSK